MNWVEIMIQNSLDYVDQGKTGEKICVFLFLSIFHRLKNLWNITIGIGKHKMLCEKFAIQFYGKITITKMGKCEVSLLIQYCHFCITLYQYIGQSQNGPILDSMAGFRGIQM